MPQPTDSIGPDAAALIEGARSALNRGDLPAAAEFLADCHSAMGAGPLPPAAWLERGRLAASLELYREARKFLERASIDPKLRSAAVYEHGRTWIARGRLEMAVEVLLPLAGDTTALIPWRCHAYSSIGRALAGLGRHRAAQHAMEAAGKFGVVSSQLLADDAFRMMALGGVDEARNQLVQAVHSDGTCGDAIELLARLLHSQQRPEDAIQVLQFGIEQLPHMIRLHALAARILEECGQPADAVGLLIRAIALSPRGEFAHRSRLALVRCLSATGEKHAAKEALEEFIQELRDHRRLPGLRAQLDALDRASGPRIEIRSLEFACLRRRWYAPNALANVLRLHLPDFSQDAACEPFAQNGVRWSDLTGFLTSIPGLTARCFLSDPGELVEILKRGFPVILGVGGTEGRWIVAVGHDPALKTYKFQDPKREGALWLDEPWLIREWAYTGGLAVLPILTSDLGRIAGLGMRGVDDVARWTDAMRLRADGRADLASRELKALVQASPHFLPPVRTLAEIALADGKLREALDLVRPLAATDGASLWARRIESQAHLMAKNYAEGIESSGIGLREWPGEPSLRLVHGSLCLAAGQRKRGRVEVMRALDKLPASVGPRVALARDYLETGDLRRARYHLIAAMELDPENDEAASLLANMPDGE